MPPMNLLSCKNTQYRHQAKILFKHHPRGVHATVFMSEILTVILLAWTTVMMNTIMILIHNDVQSMRDLQSASEEGHTDS